MLLGTLSILLGFLISPLVKPSRFRLWLAAFYAVAAVFFLRALIGLENSSYYFAPQTIALFDLTFVVDFLSLVFASLITVVGTFVMAYSAYYIDDENGPRFSTLMSFFTLAMLGLVFSYNLLGLYMFWELTTFASYFLISFNSKKPEARAGALQALLVTAFGGACLLIGFLFLGGIGQSYSLLEAHIPLDHPLLGISLILIFIGALAKSAQFPFHFWLANASDAPAPATAYLHSATLVQAGIFLLLRLGPIVGKHPYWTEILMPVGIVTAILSCVLMLFERDLKRLIAHATVASLGVTTYLIGVNSTVSRYVALVFLIAHALYKAPVFLLAGNIERSAGTRDLTQITRLYPRMKGTLLATFLAIFSVIGLAPAITFRVKDLFFRMFGKVPLEFGMLVFIFSATASVAFTFLYLFLRARSQNEEEGTFFNDPNDPAALWLPPFISLALSLLLGIGASFVLEFLSDGYGHWVGLGLGDLTSAADRERGVFATTAVISSAIIFAIASLRVREMKQTLFSTRQAWRFVSNFLVRGANIFFGRLQNQPLENYSLAFFAFLLFLLSQIYGMELGLPLLSLKFPMVTPFEVTLIVAMIASAVGALKAPTNLAAVVVLGVIGYGTGYLYLVNAAPDLALVQFAVETLILLLLVLTFKHLPKQPYHPQQRRQKYFFMGVSAVAGIFVAVLTFLASSSMRQQTLTDYYGAKSLSRAHGQNVVNTTVANFRGLDTLGEITVLALGAVGVASLAARKKLNKARS